MKASVLIPSFDQVIEMNRLVKEAKKLRADEIIIGKGKTRGLQYNNAAKKAKGDILILLHQNSIKFPKNLVKNIKRVMKDPEVVGGGVNMKFDKPGWLLSWVAFTSNYFRMRCRWIPYCDQTIFVRKSIFKELKGFKNMSIFEDTEFSLRLREKGKMAFLKGPVITSSHRFLKKGVLLHTLRCQLLKVCYHCGMSQKRMKRMYER